MAEINPRKVSVASEREQLWLRPFEVQHFVVQNT